MVDQRVGHCLVETRPGRDSGEVRLTLGFRDCNEVLVGQTLGLFENRPGYFDVVIRGEAAHGLLRRVSDRRKPLTQFDHGAAFDVANQLPEDDIEQCRLVHALVG